MRLPPDRKIGLRTALVAIVIGGIVLSAAALHLAWWRTATSVSRDLVDVLESQITAAVRRDWWGVVGEVERLSQGMRDLLDEATGEDQAESILLAASRPSRSLSWLLLVPPQGEVIAIESLSDDALRLLHARGDGDDVRAMASIARPHATAPPATAPAPARLHARGEGWLDAALASENPLWVDVEQTPDGAKRAVAFAGKTDRGVLAAMIDYDRFARLLGAIAVGRTGGSYVVGPEGGVVIAPKAGERTFGLELEAAARAAGERVAARPEAGKNIDEKVRLEVDRASYAVELSPLWFKGWQLATIVPEAEFLAGIDRTIRMLALGLALVLLVAGYVVATGARRFLAVPVTRVAQDLRHVERFELEDIPHRPSRLVEIDRLSAAIARMAAGLADFAKFIPTELVRSLLASGVRAEPGGERRELTVLFADLAGFTGLSERLGDRVVPIVGQFLELASQAVEQEGGTVDKFIGDAVMAFWGAPLPDADQALHACRAALAIEAAMRAASGRGEPLGQLKVRIGLNTGPAIVGNVGSARRLNYTALGDTVNLASRLEGVNKVYGTTILLSAATEARAGGAVRTREIDTVAVVGRSEGVRILELTGLAGTAPPAVHARYAEALALYCEAC
ncbi:MAG TPA: adenylate/guanylate cyclase domain-containing protein, partial [Geminicoccaceae bacterium]|nr:adenylate/guanylate cyclase domain-containing protein [Geminicoccaceae bacterium]